jgi:hypothetical protein
LDLVTRLVTNKRFGDVEIPVVYETKKSPSSTLSTATQLIAHHGRHLSFFPLVIGFIVGIVVTYLFTGRNKRSGYQAV